MIAPASVPSDETVVKKPGSCPPGMPGEDPAAANFIGRDVGTFQTVTLFPPLATIRGTESLAASKYDWPHQHPPMPTVSRTRFGPLGVYPPKFLLFIKYMLPSLPAAAARGGSDPTFGNSKTPPDPKSASDWSSAPTSEGVKKLRSCVRSELTLATLSEMLVTLL